MSLPETAESINPRLYARLAATRAELHLVGRQLEQGRHGPRRQLLDQRFEAIQARAADIFARIAEARTAA